MRIIHPRSQHHWRALFNAAFQFSVGLLVQLGNRCIFGRRCIEKAAAAVFKTFAGVAAGLRVASYFFKPLYSFFFLFFALTTVCVIARILSSEPATKPQAFPLTALKRIGVWSYSIYLLHEPLLNMYTYGTIRFFPEQYRTHALVFLLVLTLWPVVLCISILWYRVFELPGIALGKRFIKQSNPARGFQWCYAGLLLLLVAGSCLASARWTPPSVEENNNLAWSLATDPDPAKRNGAVQHRFQHGIERQLRVQQHGRFQQKFQLTETS